MKEYVICRDNSPSVFRNTCNQIEERFSELEKKDLLVDVDGSTIQSYFVNKKKISVLDDYDIGIVWVKSELELPMFDKFICEQ